MTCPIITEYINNYKSQNSIIDINDFKKKLYDDYSIMTKYYEEDNLLLVYHKFGLSINSELEEECRSLVIDTINLKIISYTCPNPIENREAQQFLLNNSDLELEIYKCYEGTILSLFNHNNKWYLSTRRCLDSKDSNCNQTNYYDMFIEVLTKENMSFDDFTKDLNPEYGYYFVLLHHSNQNIVDYTKLFGENYSRLFLISVRLKEDQIEIFDYDFNSYTNIMKPEKMSMEDFSAHNQVLNVDVDLEGIIIKTRKDNKLYLFKLQTNSYQFSKAIGPDRNIFKGYLYLYQIGILKQYIENNKEHKNLEKIVNPYNPSEAYDTVGVVDCVYKVLTSELFELYKLLWSLSSREQYNMELYNLLPKEYKDILYGLRGVYFKVKANPEKIYFGVRNIYQYLKSVNIEQICALLRQRKLMFNWVIISKTNIMLNLFRTTSNHCDKVHLKLMAIFTNKLFPEIMSTDVPQLV
jgi:hypothetical protein